MPENKTPVNKAQAIRGFLAEHPDASPKRVAEALAAQGIQITPAFVAAVKAMRKSPPQPVPEPNMPPRHISFGEGKLFYKLYAMLCSYANGHLNVVQGDFSDPEQFTSLPPGTRLEVRDALCAQPELIDQFVQENPAQLSTEDLAIVAGWKHAVIGDFYVFRYLKKYAVFLKAEAPMKAYGVLALASPFEEVVGPHLPVMVKGVLLPINGRIIYDGLLSSYRIDKAFGVGESTGQGKSKMIRNLLRIRQFDPKWTLPSRLDDNPRVWMLSVNGFIMDMRDAPRELQVEAFEKGLIPYIPADRRIDSDEEE